MSQTLEQRLYNGDRAREVLENEVFIAVFDGIESELTEAWKTSPVRDPAGREEIWRHLTALQKVKSSLVKSLETGKLAQLELKHQQTLRDRMKAGWGSLTA